MLFFFPFDKDFKIELQFVWYFTINRIYYKSRRKYKLQVFCKVFFFSLKSRNSVKESMCLQLISNISYIKCRRLIFALPWIPFTKNYSMRNNTNNHIFLKIKKIIHLFDFYYSSFHIRFSVFVRESVARIKCISFLRLTGTIKQSIVRLTFYSEWNLL